ncbi:MAG: peptide ABC transporter substrate-binding protein [Puniceicoccales bacterium]|jgi:oligopeptide transport system substrate-binding protein|nr:peptide ABC transporter substrate-binding protein [Puniceicoccales bacterium]
MPKFFFSFTLLFSRALVARFLFLGVLLGAGLLTACRRREAPVVEAARASILIVNNATEPVSLDPHVASGAIDLRIVSGLFEGLLVNDPESLEPCLALAESHSVSENGLVHTFCLREGAQWADGSALGAADFLFAWERVLSPRLASPNAAMFFVVRNARAFYEGRLASFAETGFAAPDARTLRITLEHPCPHFASLICHAAWVPVPRHAILRCGSADAPGTPWTRPENIVGNGAFALQSWKVADHIELARNPHYWNAARVRLNGVRFLAIPDSLAEERAFRSGLLHITSTVPPMKVRSRLAQTGTDEAQSLRLDPFFSTTFIRVNTRIKPLDDVRVRRALALALHRRELAENVMRAGETPAFSLTPPGTAGYVCTTQVPEDLAEARRLLTEAGYPDGEGFPTLRYLYHTHETSQLVAQALQEMWSRNLGIRVELASQEWKIYKHAMVNGDYQLIRSAWSGDYPDPASFLELFTTHSEQNQTGWSDAGYDAAIHAASQAADPVTRLAHFQEAEKRLLDSTPIIPLVHNRNKFLIRPEVRGWYPNALDIHPLSAVWLAPTEE